MYGVAGEKATGRSKIGRFFTNFADPTYNNITFLLVSVIVERLITEFSIHEVPLFQNSTSCKSIYNNTARWYYYI